MGIPLTQLPPTLRKQIDNADRPEIPKHLQPGVTNEAREKAIAKDEREIQGQIANLLRLHGLWFTQSRMDRRTANTVGTPDFLFPYKGHWIAWEVKCPWNQKLRPEQAQARDKIIAQGGLWRLITSLQEAQQHLREIDRATANVTQP